MPKRRQLRAFDLKQIEGFEGLLGVDEAGRGALAGPVVAGAVLVNKAFLESKWASTQGSKVNDSKQLSSEEREEIWEALEKCVNHGLIHINYGIANVAEIETLNILGATKLAMKRALEGVYPPEVFVQRTEPDLFSSVKEREAFKPSVSCKILVDGLALRNFPYPHLGIVKGDARSLCIAMASIVAKVTRDRLMITLDKKHKGYGFAQHKGYGTEEHRNALLKLGKSVEHREMFLRKLFSERVDPDQMDFLSGSEST